MKCSYACGSAEHSIARRQFLGGLTAGAGAVVGGLSLLTGPAAAARLAKDRKRVLVVNMAGGLCQLESWDPKPATETGGPFRAISTSVPGIHVCELLPHTAKQMHHLALVRSLNTKENDHGKGAYLMFTGRRQTPAANYPRLGAVAAKALGGQENSLPGHIRITPGGGGGRSNDAAYLGPKYGSISLGNGKPPRNTTRPDAISDEADRNRHTFRRNLNQHFSMRRRTAMTDAYTANYEQALELMKRREVFDLSKESKKKNI